MEAQSVKERLLISDIKSERKLMNKSMIFRVDRIYKPFLSFSRKWIYKYMITDESGSIHLLEHLDYYEDPNLELGLIYTTQDLNSRLRHVANNCDHAFEMWIDFPRRIFPVNPNTYNMRQIPIYEYPTGNAEKVLQLLQRGKSFAVKLENVKFIRGEVDRYVGCSFCNKSMKNRPNSSGHILCPDRCRRNLEMKPDLLYRIYDAALEDSEGNKLDYNIVIFNKAVEELLKKKAEDWTMDIELSKFFQELININLFNVEFHATREDEYWRFTLENIIVHTPCNNVTSVEIVSEATAFTDKEIHPGFDENTPLENFQIPSITRRSKEFEMKLMKITSASSEENDCGRYYPYVINNVPGFILIINQEKFDRDPSRQINDRIGSQVDIQNIKKIFGKDGLGYTIFVKEDVRKDYLNQWLEEFVLKFESCNVKPSSCWLFLLSHGTLSTFSMTDGEIDYYKEIVNKIGKDSRLEGIPKIFFIGSCREFKVLTPENNFGRKSFLEDVIIIHGSQPGHKSYRRIKEGSYSIICFLQVIARFAAESTLFDMIIRTQEKMTNTYDPEVHGEDAIVQQAGFEPAMFHKFYLKVPLINKDD